ncbi:MAG: trehalose-6-phosphate synthase, partial [Chloroflexota bacterium]|nr:trehalose-6-phosphate synthase [Chloroflexota bacterium]
ADGMNLVAKEGAIVNDRDGVLVLSTTAGAYEELGPACLGVDPLDVAGTADALARALTMPAPERQARARQLRATIEAADLSGWMRRQLRDLELLGAQVGARATLAELLAAPALRPRRSELALSATSRSDLPGDEAGWSRRRGRAATHRPVSELAGR